MTVYFRLSSSHKTFLFSDMKFLCFLNFCLIICSRKAKSLQKFRKKIQDDRAGLGTEASDLHCTAHDTTEDLLNARAIMAL